MEQVSLLLLVLLGLIAIRVMRPWNDKVVRTFKGLIAFVFVAILFVGINTFYPASIFGCPFDTIAILILLMAALRLTLFVIFQK